MEAFTQASGISSNDLKAIIVPLLVSITAIIVAIGIMRSLKLIRSSEIGQLEFFGQLFKGVGVVIAIIALAYYMNVA